MAIRDNTPARATLEVLRQRLPRGWCVREAPHPHPAGIDTLVHIVDPGGNSGPLGIEVRTQLTPKQAIVLGHVGRQRLPNLPLLVAVPYLSPSTRERLRELEVPHLDFTGNAHIELTRPGLFIQTQGSIEDPNPRTRPVRSLRGSKIARVVRALIDAREPLGVRALAEVTCMDAGYVSRILSLLDTEALVSRSAQGRLETVDWLALLRRWANDAPMAGRGEPRTYREPRGPNAIREKLAHSQEQYAITGGIAAAVYAPIAAPAQIAVWIVDALGAAQRLGLVLAESPQRSRLTQTEATSPVTLIEPHDIGVFAGAELHDDNQFAAPSQVAADLLTSGGRGPNKAEVLLEWMRVNEALWRR